MILKSYDKINASADFYFYAEKISENLIFFHFEKVRFSGLVSF